MTAAGNLDGNMGWKVGTVIETSTQTPTARSLTLNVPSWPGNIAGQHVDLRLTAEDGYTAVRSYSLASSGPGSRLELAVDKLPTGEVSPYLVDVVETGDQLELRGPLGGWFVWRPEDTGSVQTNTVQPVAVQLIAGGSGIVPLMAMIRSHAVSASAAPFRLLYSVRTPDDVFYAEELATLERESELLAVTYVYTRRTPLGWPVPAGRVTDATLKSTTFQATDAPSVFVCGPTGFVESVATRLVAIGHDSAAVKTERFGGV